MQSIESYSNEPIDSEVEITKNRIITISDGKYGLSDSLGKSLIPCIYDKIRPIPFVRYFGYGYEDVIR